MKRKVCMIALGTLLTVGVLGGCSEEAEPVPKEISGAESTSPAPPSPAPSQEAPSQEAAGDPVLASPEAVRLDYADVEWQPSPIRQAALTDIQVRKELGHQLLAYARDTSDAEEGLFLGLADGSGHVAEIGSLYAEHYLPELTVEEKEWSGERIVAVQGICGANCAFNYLFDHRDGELALLFKLYGGLQFADLDNDNRTEMVVHAGRTVSEIEIYRRIDGRLLKANVNEALGADNGVGYKAESHVFETVYDGRMVQYRYGAEDLLEPVQ